MTKNTMYGSNPHGRAMDALQGHMAKEVGVYPARRVAVISDADSAVRGWCVNQGGKDKIEAIAEEIAAEYDAKPLLKQ